MKLLVDMSLSPTWVPFLRDHDIQSMHWADVGDPRAPDPVVMAWGRTEGYVVFTHDLDFGALLAGTGPTHQASSKSGTMT